jgi:uracil-DNA glycosylase
MSEDIARLAAEIAACRICVESPRGRPLPHEPRPVFRISATARLCICGQAPGIRVHRSGIPFTDPSGVRLRAWMGVSEEEFYDVSRVAIVPMGFCFPGHDAKGGDLPPRKECAEAWRTRIFNSLPQFGLVLLIGLYSQVWHLGQPRSESATSRIKRWRDKELMKNGVRFFPLPHPSWRNSGWLKRNPWFETELLPELRSEVRGVLAAS